MKFIYFFTNVNIFNKVFWKYARFFFSSKLHKGVNMKIQISKLKNILAPPPGDSLQYRRKLSYLLHV